MGGIYGINGTDDRNLFRRMGEALEHRGRLLSEYTEASISIGHRDFQKALVCVGHDGSAVAFDGEIYNDGSLTRETLGMNRASVENQAGIVLRLYEACGESFVEKLVGPFALALWDQRKKLLLLARDPVGERPLYYSLVGNIFLFASEIKSMLCFDGLRPTVDLEALDFFLSYGHTPIEKTLFRGVRRIPRGAIAIFANEQTRIRTFAQIDWGAHVDYQTSRDEWPDILYKTIMSIVKARLDGCPLPAGILLGGIDSSTIASMMRRLTDDSIHAFTAFYEEAEFNEPYARSVAEYLSLNFHNPLMKARDAINILHDLAWVYDDLVADLYTSLPTYFILRHATETVRTIFAGDLGGVPAGERVGYGGSYRLGSKIPAPIRAWMIRYSLHNRSTLARRRPFRLLDAIVRDCATRISPEVKLLEWWRFFKEDQLQELYEENLSNRKLGDIAGPVREAVLKLYYPAWADFQTQHTNYVRWMLRMIETQGFWIPRTERIASSMSLHTARPYMNRSVIETYSKIPPTLKFGRAGETKWMLRAMCLRYGLLPRDVIYQRKVAYACPIEQWLTGELKEYVEQTIIEGTNELRGLLRPDSMIHVARRGTPHQKYALLMLILWHKHFIH